MYTHIHTCTHMNTYTYIHMNTHNSGGQIKASFPHFLDQTFKILHLTRVKPPKHSPLDHTASSLPTLKDSRQFPNNWLTLLATDSKSVASARTQECVVKRSPDPILSQVMLWRCSPVPGDAVEVVPWTLRC